MKKYALSIAWLFLLTLPVLGQVIQTKPKRITLSNELKIAYTATGNGDTALVFVHGLGGYQQVWQKTTRELKNHFKCIALDLPGYGFSSTGDYPFKRTVYAINAQARQGLGLGFSSYLAGSDGQRIVLKDGLLPAQIPPRLVKTSRQ